MTFLNKKNIIFFSIVFVLVLSIAPDISCAKTIKVNKFKKLETATTLDGHNIPTNPATQEIGVGSVCIEMHLATKKTDPWADGSYLELNSLPKRYKTINYLTGPGSDLITYDQWDKNTKTIFPGGSFGHMEPQQEMWYLNMRWEYVDWYVDSKGCTRTKNINWASLKWHKQHRKVLVTNLETGLQAIGYIGDSGPGLGLGVPSGNRIAGLSPDLMYYLSNQDRNKGIPTTEFGRDNSTKYKFEWVIDQNVPLGPVSINKKNKTKAIKIYKRKVMTKNSIEKKTASILETKEKILVNAGKVIPKDLGKGYVRINYSFLPMMGVWSKDTPTELPVGNLYPIVDNQKDWIKIYIPEDDLELWVSPFYTTVLSV